MTLEALNSAATPLHHHVHVSWTKRRHTKRVFNDDYFAERLIALTQSGGATSSSTAKQTKIHSSTVVVNSSTSRRHRASQPKTAAEDSRSIHECSVCSKIFPTGQGLGGHMRKHYGGVISRNGGRKSRANSFDGGTVSTDVTSVSDGNGVVDMPLPPSSSCLDLTLKLW